MESNSLPNPHGPCGAAVASPGPDNLPWFSILRWHGSSVAGAAVSLWFCMSTFL